ncbi:FGGY family carbohydrate kinase [Fuscovulum ytuae]|uniref:FGGY family carbohydrate kinase n=1 Tax=Fuscovulum ytuae TaxID=3042299 RepID=A0ABY8Q4T6_9RHOB|nr:FGGY family carbohydrate kinase [Fuscovulum sp. YMD61]WGV15883.1 FGGY family carbohydrate kinase [Fuscovulum sp. YMD61]
MGRPGSIAVLDVGKSNVKLSACDAAGHVVETLTTPNRVLPGPPWRHHDLRSLNEWVLAGLADLGRRHPLAHFVASGHGSGGVLVGDDPDAGGDGVVLPMVDYEQPLPDGLAKAYAPLAGDFFDRGSAVMMAATHTARQMFWAERDRPADFARARWCLGIPQYWAWRLTGMAVSEATILGAQSHLWNVARGDWSPIVAGRGWGRLMPPFAKASDDLGPVRAALEAKGVPQLRVHAGVHDSSANFHRYRAAGMAGICVISTGTWIVALADGVALSRLDEARGMTLNADVAGAPVGGALTMGGREYSAVAGDQPEDARVDRAVLVRLIARGTMALPSFGTNDGQFPGTAGLGRIVGPPPASAAERHALAVLYVALLTVECGNRLDATREWVLDGSFLRDPAFAALVAALRPGRVTRVNAEGYGIAAGAAALFQPDRAMPAPDLADPLPLPGLDGLTDYAARWRALAEDGTK